MSGFQFPKKEKLKSSTEFSRIYEKGRSITSFPFKAVFLIEPAIKGEAICQTGFIVSKRNFKKAVDRNRIKRMMREAYRLNKGTFYEHLTTSGQNCRLILIFLERKMPEFSEVQGKIILILQRLTKEHEEADKRNNGIPSKGVSKGN